MSAIHKAYAGLLQESSEEYHCIKLAHGIDRLVVFYLLGPIDDNCGTLKVCGRGSIFQSSIFRVSKQASE
jgi:hypothetical protein